MIATESIQLIVTSPPYPMIEMWDDLFSDQSLDILRTLKSEDGKKSFELMHKELDKVWEECNRVLVDGGFLCINIGDATRNINNDFQLYSNHTRILQKLIQLGFQILPEILWRKQTNAPNKFMGSGMLPAGAYVTLEHEFILIARKGGKRIFKTAKEKSTRQESGYFWEERNTWFSDIWDFKGISQKLQGQLREKSAAFPFELAYRLINMYSVKKDTVLDPFTGTGTTMLASIASERNSIGIELQENFSDLIHERISSSKKNLNKFIDERIENHSKFIKNRLKEKKEIKYDNIFHKFQVVTKQEVNIIIRKITCISALSENKYEVEYE